MEPTRLMLDSMVFDAVADDESLRARLVDLVEKGLTELLITHIQADQLASIPDVDTRKRLLAVAFSLGLRSPPTSVFVLGLSRLGMARLGGEDTEELYRRLSVGNPRHAADAAIGLTAREAGASLVTGDGRYRRRVERVLPDVTVWSLDDLRRYAYNGLIPGGGIGTD